MDPKQQFQQDLQQAMRTRNQPRVNVIRMVLAAFEQAQETMGKRAFDSSDSAGTNIQPDRHQVLSGQAIQDILLNEMQRRREAVDLLRIGRQEERAEIEEIEMAILEHYLAKCS